MRRTKKDLERDLQLLYEQFSGGEDVFTDHGIAGLAKAMKVLVETTSEEKINKLNDLLETED